MGFVLILLNFFANQGEQILCISLRIDVLIELEKGVLVVDIFKV